MCEINPFKFFNFLLQSSQLYIILHTTKNNTANKKWRLQYSSPLSLQTYNYNNPIPVYNL